MLAWINGEQINTDWKCLGKQTEFRSQGKRILIWKLQKGKGTNTYWILREGGG